MPLQGTAAVYATGVSIGMLHGVEPGHGGPVAAMFALRSRHRWWCYRSSNVPPLSVIECAPPFGA
jgi:hypothetical protein